MEIHNAVMATKMMSAAVDTMEAQDMATISWIRVAVMTRFRAMRRQGVLELGACFLRHPSRAAMP